MTWYPAPLLLQSLSFRWRPGIGDPTALGWSTVIAYLIAAGLCLRAAGAAARARAPRVAQAYGVLCAVLVLLGANKQLDLQTLFTEIGRQVALRGGWYAQRHAVQVAFVGGLVVAGGGSLAAGLWWLRGQLAQFWLAGLGLALLVAFVLTRAAWFHRVGGLGYAAAAPAWHAALELAGIACAAIDAARSLRARGRPSRSG